MKTTVLSCCLAALFAGPNLAAADGPPLPLAVTYRADSSVSDFWVSEKLDGVRAYWDGKQLVSRQGHPIAAPAWFLAGLPKDALDGELWMGRGSFEALSAAVRRKQPEDAEWRRIRYMVFELPGDPGNFSARLQKLRSIVAQANTAWVQAIHQFRLANRAELMARYQEVLQGGGEGLMLHRAEAPFQTGRVSDLQKLKPFDDAEARVIGHLAGKGKYQGQTGALLLQTPEGRRFAVGSGLTDELRQSPPAIGTLVSYRYSGLTARGTPRHPRFFRLAESG